MYCRIQYRILYLYKKKFTTITPLHLFPMDILFVLIYLVREYVLSSSIHNISGEWVCCFVFMNDTHIAIANDVIL